MILLTTSFTLIRLQLKPRGRWDSIYNFTINAIRIIHLVFVLLNINHITVINRLAMYFSDELNPVTAMINLEYCLVDAPS